jgi:hypothetical protein
VQVRAGDAAGRADVAQHLTGLQFLADLHADLREVAIHRHQALAVIDEHIVAIEEIFTDVDHLARQWRLDRRARGRGDIHAAVRPARFAVEHAAQPERARSRAGYGRRQAQCRRRGGRERVERGAHLFSLARDAGFVFRRQVHLARRHLELLHAVLLGRDLERELPWIGARLLDIHVIFAGFGIERDADDGDPAVRGACDEDRLFLVRDDRTFIRRARQLERDHAARHCRNARRRERGRESAGRESGREQQHARQQTTHRFHHPISSPLRAGDPATGGLRSRCRPGPAQRRAATGRPARG